MNIGMVDVDNYQKMGGCFPNLPLMKLSAWHKKNGDNVEWYYPLISGHKDVVYKSKVFKFTEDYNYFIDADKVISGGTGYCIRTENGIEVFDKSKDLELPDEIEHIYPDYSLYGITDTAYGFTSRGCPRGCHFCVVGKKETLKSHKVADLREFWDGQKYIELLDPNTLACKDWEDILGQLIESRASVNFNQGVDIRLMTPEKAEMIRKVKVKGIHFAWDRYKDGDLIKPRLEMFKSISGWDRHKVTVYILCNYDSSMEENIERVEYVKGLGLQPFVMLYNKEEIPRGDILFKLARYANNPYICWTVPTFNEYRSNVRKEKK